MFAGLPNIIGPDVYSGATVAAFNRIPVLRYPGALSLGTCSRIIYFQKEQTANLLPEQ
jgi:hypothetical protein